MKNIDWHTGTPDKEGIYLCKVEGARFAKYSAMRWSDGFWWLYYVDYTGQTSIEGWFCIGAMKVNEWSLVEETNKN